MESTDSNVILKAMAEIRRRQIIATKFNPQTEDMYDNSFVHAVMPSIYPFKHEHSGLNDNLADILNAFPFHETYDADFKSCRQDRQTSG
jgi:hypothetical protein